MSVPTPLLDFFKRGEADRDARLLAAQGGLAPRAHEQLALLVHLLGDADAEVKAAADATLNSIPKDVLSAALARTDTADSTREYFAERGVFPIAAAAEGSDDPLVDPEPAIPEPDVPLDETARESLTQQIAKMNFTQRLRAAVKGTREMRAVLIRDPNKMIAASVLSSPKLTESEVAAFSRMANVGEDILRIIATNRAWLKNYGVVVGLTKNPKTPLALSLNLMGRLNDRDMAMLSIDRNVPEPLRVAARKKVVAATSRGLARPVPRLRSSSSSFFAQSFRISARPSMKTVARSRSSSVAIDFRSRSARSRSFSIVSFVVLK